MCVSFSITSLGMSVHRHVHSLLCGRGKRYLTGHGVTREKGEGRSWRSGGAPPTHRCQNPRSSDSLGSRCLGSLWGSAGGGVAEEEGEMLFVCGGWDADY